MHSVPGAFAFISRAFCCISGIVRRDRFSSHSLLRGMNVTVMAELTEDGSNGSRKIGGIELAGAKHPHMPHQESKREGR
jgi:hypothetical protein